MANPVKPKKDPYALHRIINSVIMLIVLIFILFTDLEDTMYIAAVIAFWALAIESSLLYIASEVWKLRHSVYND